VISGRVIRGLGALVVVASALLMARPARALDARTEAAAKDALKKAASDFASADYATALARLDRASTTCGVNRCARTTKALVLRDLGVMQIRSGDPAAAENSFAEALKSIPDLELPTKYSAPEVRAAWDRAKQVTSAGKGTESPGGGEQPAGDFTHTPAAEQKIKTPLPIYLEYPGDPPPARVVVKYKGGSMSEWGHVDLKRTDDGWEGMIPCTDVARGTMRYWIQGVDREGEPVATSGDPRHPYTVAIRARISGEAPHLPDRPPPRTCTGENGDDAGGAEGGEDEGSQGAHPPVHGGTYSRLWVGVSLAIDLMSMPSGHDVCALTPPSATSSGGEPMNSAELYCTNPNGTDFPSRSSPAQNSALIPGRAGQSSGGLQAGDVRILLAADYALLPNLLAGVRFGYVANAYTGVAASKDGRAAGFDVHFEARATYLLGDYPLAHVGFVPVGFAGLGLAEFDGHSSSVVALTGTAGQQAVSVWRTDGPFFLVLGGGARYQFSPRIAFTGAIRLNIAAGNGALVTFGPEISAAYGF